MFSHIDNENNPTMVDITEKRITARAAKASAIVYLPDEVIEHFVDGDIKTKKGAVLQTAIIAGTMAAKRTHELIPFCHPISIESIKFKTQRNGNKLEIECLAKNSGKTGVEMEALQGVTSAALTVYDMCKALSHDIRIEQVQLVEKTGGKKDFFRS